MAAAGLCSLTRAILVVVRAEQLQRAVQKQALREAQILRMQGQDVTPQQVLQFYQKNPQAVAQIRAPLFEEQVIDHILERATVTQKKVSKDDLLKDPEGEAA